MGTTLPLCSWQSAPAHAYWLASVAMMYGLLGSGCRPKIKQIISAEIHRAEALRLRPTHYQARVLVD